MNLLRNSIEDFISRAFRIRGMVPGEYFGEVVTKLNINRSRYVTIGIEPGENLIETLRWNCRVSRHSESSLQPQKAQKHENKKMKYELLINQKSFTHRT